MKNNMNGEQMKIRRKIVQKQRSKDFDKDAYNKKRYAKIKAFREGLFNG